MSAAADFTLPDASTKPVSLRDYRGKNVVLAFYPADWTPVCTHELALFEETLDDIHAKNAEIVAVSTDTAFSHRAWADQQRLTFPLLSDFWPHGQVCRAYGVFNETNGISERALFFIDAEGNLRDSWVAENPDIAPGLDLVFDTLDRMQEAPRA
jgi:peroxiredoxin